MDVCVVELSIAAGDEPSAVGGTATMPVLVRVSSDLADPWQGSLDLPVSDFAALDAVEEAVKAAPRGRAFFEEFGRSRDGLVKLGQSLFDASLGAWGGWAELLRTAREQRHWVRIVLRSASPPSRGSCCTAPQTAGSSHWSGGCR